MILPHVWNSCHLRLKWHPSTVAPVLLQSGTLVPQAEQLLSLGALVGGFHSHGDTPKWMDGLQWKMPSFELDDWGYPHDLGNPQLSPRLLDRVSDFKAACNGHCSGFATGTWDYDDDGVCRLDWFSMVAWSISCGFLLSLHCALRLTDLRRRKHVKSSACVHECMCMCVCVWLRFATYNTGGVRSFAPKTAWRCPHVKMALCSYCVWGGDSLFKAPYRCLSLPKVYASHSHAGLSEHSFIPSLKFFWPFPITSHNLSNSEECTCPPPLSHSQQVYHAKNQLGSRRRIPTSCTLDTQGSICKAVPCCTTVIWPIQVHTVASHASHWHVCLRGLQTSLKKQKRVPVRKGSLLGDVRQTQDQDMDSIISWNCDQPKNRTFSWY